jgi:hypothetical protein
MHLGGQLALTVVAQKPLIRFLGDIRCFIGNKCHILG